MTTKLTLELERRDAHIPVEEKDGEGRTLYRLVKQVIAQVYNSDRTHRVGDENFSVGIDENANAAINKALAQVHYFDENLGPEK